MGGLAAALCVVAAYFLHPGLTFEMDRPLPAFITGMHGNERDPQGTFAWTSGQVSVSIPGLDRQVPWSCTIRFRGARTAGTPQPTLTVVVDGRPVAEALATNDYQELPVVIPSAPGPGAALVMNVAPTFTPGGGDPRALGVQLDRFLCRPSSALRPAAVEHAVPRKPGRGHASRPGSRSSACRSAARCSRRRPSASVRP